MICGLEGDKPFICAMDLIGAPLYAEDFVLCGTTATEALYGVCETLYKPNLVSLCLIVVYIAGTR